MVYRSKCYCFLFTVKPGYTRTLYYRIFCESRILLYSCFIVIDPGSTQGGIHSVYNFSDCIKPKLIYISYCVKFLKLGYEFLYDLSLKFHPLHETHSIKGLHCAVNYLLAIARKYY